ncbi:MAG: hypothetical protein AAGG44_10625 [Planctomycetota bacterium]
MKKRIHGGLGLGLSLLLAGGAVAQQNGSAPLRLESPSGKSILASAPLGEIFEAETIDSAPATPAADPNTGELVRQRYPNGKVNVERYVVESSTGDFVNHGTYVRYNNQGQVVVSGTYKMGQREGDWSKQLGAEEAKNLAGTQMLGFKPPYASKAAFRNGKLHGDWTCSDSSGKLVFVWSYADGKRNGPSTTFNTNGEVLSSIVYRDNLADGPAKVALKADKSPEDIQFENGRMLRRVDQFYPASQGKQRAPKSQDWYLVPTPYNISSSSWETNNVEYKQFDKEDMIRHGRAITFFPNGQRESEGQYKLGKRTGTFAWWYSNGQQKTVGEYQHDLEQGRWSWWHDNGMREATGTYTDGTKVDQWSVWGADGKLVKRANPNAASRTAKSKTLEISR